jgi:predicted adenine nucleotide alpha hydrolase (AANH) superfamily ATPase
MNILLHICCGPCAIFPVRTLRSEGRTVTGFFFNHNIHPYQEYRKRLDTVTAFAQQEELPAIIRDEYRLEEFLAAVATNPAERCRYCYASRLEETAKAAAERGFAAWSSSLLYSRYQRHDEIRRLGDELGQRYGVPFHYEDYRAGWQEGIRLSKEQTMYRQQYCGCIYSEKERYAPRTTGT